MLDVVGADCMSKNLCEMYAEASQEDQKEAVKTINVLNEQGLDSKPK